MKREPCFIWGNNDSREKELPFSKGSGVIGYAFQTGFQWKYEDEGGMTGVQVWSNQWYEPSDASTSRLLKNAVGQARDPLFRHLVH